MSNLKDLTDEELVSMCKLGKSEAELELYNRYLIHSKKMAGDIYYNYAAACNIEFEDLVSIGLFSFYNAVLKFRMSHSFFKYWKKIAYYEMMNEVKSQSISYILEDTTAKMLGFDESIHYELFASNDISQAELERKRKIAFEDACKELSNDNSPLDPLAIDVFLLYLDGYNFKEISKKLSIKYCAVRRIHSQVVDILKGLLAKK